MTSPRLHVRHSETDVVDTLGPGRRSVVWVQGCTIHCPGCIVPEMWGPVAGEWMDPADLADRLLGPDPTASLTVSGGEPTEQPHAVAALLAAARRMGRTTWVYTGRVLEDLLDEDDPSVLEMLAHVDVLVDGRFEQSLAASLQYRGSSNQRILRLTDAIDVTEFDVDPGGRVSIRVDGVGGLVVIGIPPPEFLNRLRTGLVARGVSVSPREPWE
jgi:anaerobic ribonucleoside-triphosphate reductase activating protein